MNYSRRNGLRRSWIVIFLTGLATILPAAPLFTTQLANTPPAHAAGKSNVMMILLDDLDYKTFDNMILAGRLPHIKANLYYQE